MDKSCALSLFDFNGKNIRVIAIDDRPWFVAADVCRVLEIANAKQAVEGLGVQQSILLKKSNLSQTYVSFPNRGAICLSEGGLNRLILRSDKPEARPFQD